MSHDSLAVDSCASFPGVRAVRGRFFVTLVHIPRFLVHGLLLAAVTVIQKQAHTVYELEMYFGIWIGVQFVKKR
jgi:hypothetical protein